MFFSFSFSKIVNKQSVEFNNIYNKNFYKLSDTLYGEAETKFFSSENALEKLKTYYYELSTSKAFDYLEIYNQPIEVESFLGDITFLYGYEYGAYENKNPKRILTFSDGSSAYFCNANALWCGNNFFSTFNINVDGKTYNKKDFTYDKNNPIPLIMGADYKQYYQIGDTLKLLLPMDYREAIVIGFLQNDSSIWYNNKFISLDRYIILPLQNDLTSYPNNTEEHSRQIITYLMKINGTIVSETLSANDVQIYIDEICNRCGINPASLINGSTNYQIGKFRLTINEIEKIFSYIFGVLFIFTCVLLSILTWIKTKNNLKYYAILLTYRFTRNQINMIIVLEDLLFLLVPNLLSLVFGNMFYKTISTNQNLLLVFYMIIADIIILLLGSLPSIYYLNKVDLPKNLRKG